MTRRITETASGDTLSSFAVMAQDFERFSAQTLTEHLINDFIWFLCVPLPGDKFRISVKEEDFSRIDGYY